MNPVWNELLANMAIVALSISIWSNIQLPESKHSLLIRRVLLGAVMGAGAVGVMLIPIELHGGYFVDLRRTVIAVSGLFGGPVSVLITASFAALYRFYLGGAGFAIGLMGIASAMLVGVATFYVLRGNRPSPLTIVGFAILVALTGSISLFALPTERWTAVMADMLLPSMILSFVTTSMAGFAVSNELRRREIMRANHIYRTAIECLPDAVSVTDVDGNLIIANPAAEKASRPVADGAVTGFGATERAVLQSGEATIIEETRAMENDDRRWFSTLLAPLIDRHGDISGLITHSRDITERKALEAALNESQKRVTAALTNMADGLVMFDRDQKLVFCNQKYREMFSRTADLRVPGASASSILYAAVARGELVGIPPDAVTEWVRVAVSSLRDAGTVQFPLWDGRWIESRTSPAADGTCFVVCSDITKAKQDEKTLRALNDRLAELAETDGLTGLLNRRAFDAALREELQAPDSEEQPLSLLFLDVDRFKAYNDTYGHLSGDACLREIASCLKSLDYSRPHHVARYGGEELAVILPGSREEEAVALAHDLRLRIRALDIQHVASEKGIVTASIGVATLPKRGGEADARLLVKRADEALYMAKAAGRDLVRAWSPSKPQLIAVGGNRD
ncbi:diguanylate cyclase [Pararhizobium arenae]|uniref:diguanylate cyclase n=1 Tax=Pararhizobium arenae TaxID=1856850 RepID=UPI000AEFA127|nr:diguanylate cyclase [Pararhizobium arenae]